MYISRNALFNDCLFYVWENPSYWSQTISLFYFGPSYIPSGAPVGL